MKLNILCLCLIISFSNEFSSPEMKLDIKVESEIEKFCWMAVHEHKHGVLPSEYDIREIDEDLYLQLLQEFKINNK